jgi:uncharacterized RDD family membrane protein YckC
MFTIIGGDGQEYGPVTTQQLRSWVAAGRANMETQAKIAGSDEWRRLGDFPEFAAAIEPPPIIGPAQEDFTLAERWRRLLGAIADGLLESLCWLPTSLALMQSTSELMEDGQLTPDALMENFWSNFHLSLPYLAALLALQAVLLSLRGQSIGNMLVRTRIVRADDGEPAGFMRAFLLRGFLARAIRQIPLLGAIFWIVDSCFIFRDDKRCLHDLMAGTKVVKV